MIKFRFFLNKMKNLSAKNPDTTPDLPCEIPSIHDGHRFTKDSLEKDISNEIIQHKSDQSFFKKLKKRKSEDSPENSSAVCFAQSDEIRDEYKIK